MRARATAAEVGQDRSGARGVGAGRAGSAQSASRRSRTPSAGGGGPDASIAEPGSNVRAKSAGEMVDEGRADPSGSVIAGAPDQDRRIE